MLETTFDMRSVRSAPITNITIPNVDEKLRQRLSARASEHGRSVEAEAHAILRQALDVDSTTSVEGNLADAIRALVDPVGGVELDMPPRRSVDEPPAFE